MRYQAVVVAIFAIAAASFFVAKAVKAEMFDDLLDCLKPREKESNESEYNCGMKKRLSQLGLPINSNEVISKFPTLRAMFCPCKEEPVKGLNRKSRMGTSIQMHSGGLSSRQGWREMDMYLMETLCGSQSPSINLAWAKFLDCDEDPKKFECEQMMFEAMLILAKESPSPDNCLQYVEALRHLFPARNISHDYQIDYVNINHIQYLQPEDYRHDRLYLLDIFRKDSSNPCFSRKRELSSVQYMYERCTTGRDDSDCEAILDKVKDSNCKSLLLRRKVVCREEGKYGTSVYNTITAITILAFWWCCGEQWHQKICRSCLKISVACDDTVKGWQFQVARQNGDPNNADVVQDRVNRQDAHPDLPPGPLEPLLLANDLPGAQIHIPIYHNAYPNAANEGVGNDDNEAGDDNDGQLENMGRAINEIETVNLKLGDCFMRMCRSLKNMLTVLPMSYWIQRIRSFFLSVFQSIRSFFLMVAQWILSFYRSILELFLSFHLFDRHGGHNNGGDNIIDI